MGENGESEALLLSGRGELAPSGEKAAGAAAPSGLPAHMKGAGQPGKKAAGRVVSLVVGARCGVCDLPLAGSTVQAMHRHFHEACFICKLCEKPLVAEPKVMNVGGIPHCNPCGQEAFSSKFKIGGFLPGGPGPALPGGGDGRPATGSTIAADLAAEDALEPRELNHSTLRSRPRGPTGRSRPTRSRAHTERFRERYNTVVGAEPVARPPAKKKLRGRKNVTKYDTDRPAKSKQASPVPKAKAQQKRVRHVPPQKALPRTPPQKALPPTPPPKKAKAKEEKVAEAEAGGTERASIIPDSSKGPPPTPPAKPRRQEPAEESAPGAGMISQSEGMSDSEEVQTGDSDVEEIGHEEAEEEVVVSLDLSGDNLEEDSGDEDRYAMPSISDSLADLKKMQLDFEKSKGRSRMSVWERKKREELANTLAEVSLSPRAAPHGLEEDGQVFSEEEAAAREAAKEKERLAKAARMQELKQKREAEEHKRKTRELTAIRTRLAALDEMDDEELKEVLGLGAEDELSAEEEVEVVEVDDVVTFNFEDVVPGCIEGYLQKANASAKLLQPGWRTRWFRLQEDTLVYYRERQENVLAKDNLPDGIVSLGSVQAIEACAPLRDSAKNSTFKIVTPERTYLLQADCKGDMDIWLKALNRAKQFYCKESILATAPIAAKADTEMAGYLEKLGTFSKWHKRYFILKDGVLFRYKTGGDREQMGKLPLYGTELSEYRPDKFDRCFMLTDAKGNDLILRASTEEDMHSWLNAIVKQKVMIEETVNSIVIM